MISSIITDELNNKLTDDMFSQLQSVQRRGLADTLMDELIDLIIDESLAAGYVFPNENDMCSKLNISRSTLREVYSALEAMGFITRSKAGTKINQINDIRSSVPLSYLFRKADIDEVMEYRIMLESQISYLAAKNMDEGNIEQLRAILDEMMTNNGEDVQRLTQLDIKFHYTLAIGCNNRLLLNTLSALTTQIHRSAYSGYYVDPKVTIPHSIMFHKQIFEAIKERNQKAARSATREHIKDIYIVLRNNLIE